MESAAQIKRKNKVSAKNWHEIESLYCAGAVTIHELSSRFSIPYRTIQHHLNKRKIIKGSTMADKASAPAPEKSASDIYKEDIKNIVISMSGQIREALDELPPGNTRPNQLHKLAAATDKMHKLAISTGIVPEVDEVLPVLHVIEITAEQIEAMRKQQRLDDEILGFPVVNYPIDDEHDAEDEYRSVEDDEITCEGFDENESEGINDVVA